MANSIFKLKVETSEYDQKLANAAKGIRHLADVAHKGAGELTELEKSEVDYIKALGDMETKSRTASGQVRELSSTYKELKVIYDQLNEVEKADEGGKALASSLEQIKQRAQAAQAQLDAATQSLHGNSEAGKGTSSVMEMLKDKFTVNIDAIKLFNVGMQAAEGVLNVAKDAFFNNEQQLDEWGRVVESSHSLYTGFLNALNTGDISGYLNNMSSIVQAARDAYDAMDELATYNAFNQRNVQRARTGMTESIVDFREGTGSKEDVKAAGEAYKKELRDRQKKEYETYYKKIGELALTRGVDEEGLRSVLEGTYDDYKKRKGIQPTGERPAIIGAGAYARLGTETFAQGKLEKMAEALRNLNDTELQSIQALGAQAERTGNEIAGIDRQLARVLGAGAATGGRTRTGGRSGGTTAAPDFLGSLNNAMLHATAGAGSLKSGDGGPSEIWKAIVQGANKATSSVDTLTEAFEALNKAEGNAGGFAEDGKEAKNSWTSAAAAMQQVGSAMASIEDPAAKIVGTIGQAIATMALSYAEASKQAAMNPANAGWGWIAFAATGLATMISTISAIHSATGYAQGGIVKGNTYSGDQIYGGAAMVNAGELVLNRAQQSTLAAQLGSGGDSQPVRPYVSGEQIFLGLNAYLKRSGRGEIMTSKR